MQEYDLMMLSMGKKLSKLYNTNIYKLNRVSLSAFLFFYLNLVCFNDTTLVREKDLGKIIIT